MPIFTPLNNVLISFWQKKKDVLIMMVIIFIQTIKFKLVITYFESQVKPLMKIIHY